ncbi:MAG: alkyl sulfatase dimerization domain-containing protein [Mycetocola sp.]
MAPLDYADRQDFDDVERGFIATLADPLVRNASGTVVWDANAYDFIQGDAPATVNPSLWRQGRLVAKHGLFEVVPGIYQARGIDISNISFVEGDSGVIVIDPLMSVETAAAALALYRAHRGDGRVGAVTHTNSQADHSAGVAGVAAAGTPIIAPAGFLDHSVSENVYAGAAMSRRAAYMYASDLGASSTGQMGVGLGMATSMGTMSLMPPTLDITHTGQEETVDGVRIIFQVTPGTEAPAEMNFYFPGFKAACMAENATHTLHNLLTLRGAEVRDARAWSRYLNESIALWGDDVDVVFASHHWPTWDNERINEFLRQQRDLYAYLHDQTLRRMNKGETGIEIAEDFALPAALDDAWNARGYYGSISHNIKAIYQRYLGWFDGNPAHLWEHPPVEEGKRIVALAGGADAARTAAQAAFDSGDFRWAATLASHIVFADQTDAEAKALLADTLEQLGFGAENGTWRNFFLRGASELRTHIAPPPPDTASPSVLSALTVEQMFDSLGVRLDGQRAAATSVDIDFVFTDLDRTYNVATSNGALIHADKRSGVPAAPLVVTLTKPQLLAVLTKGPAAAEHVGDTSQFTTLAGLLDTVDHQFAIVTP